ncbi:right-handed parallel beta-helix repeat-containing protein [Catenulispora subtropica]|uniref:Pectate lyase superfamily protein domain-containing protein n=1 Tax=Catenulispora subtropica TaxID=450798 RepID=A0ABP5C8Z4_9ACTN
MTSRRSLLRSAAVVGGLTTVASTATGVGVAAAATVGVDWVLATSYGADPTGAADSTSAINAALAATPVGGVCYLPAGTYATSAPIVIPPSVTLRGSHGAHLDTIGCAIKPSAGFAGLAVAASATDPATTYSAVVLLLDQTSGGYSVVSNEQRIIDLTLDCSHLPTSNPVNGIQAVGLVHGVSVDNVAILDPSARGVCGAIRNGRNPYSWRMTRVTVNGARGPYGFNVAEITDSTFVDCEAIGSSGSGWYIADDGNGHFTNCRAEWSGRHGFEVHSGGVSSCTFTACSTDRNGYHGMLIEDSGGVGPIVLTGCMFNRDGRNNGAGGAYAGLAVTGSSSPILVANCITAVHADDDGTGVQSPQYGISVTGSTYVAVDGGFYWGTVAGWHDGGSNTYLRRGPNVGEATGPVTGPTLALANSWGTSGGPTVTIPLADADQTGLVVANAAGNSNVNQPLVLLTSGLSGADALIKARVAGDSSSRVILSAAGQLSLGPGTGGQDTSWGRLGPAQIGSTDSDLVVGLAGKGLKIKEGANAKMGVLTLKGATAVTVPTTEVTANSRIFLTVQQAAGTVGPVYVSGRVPGSSFSVQGQAGDTSTVAWMIVEPA